MLPKCCSAPARHFQDVFKLFENVDNRFPLTPPALQSPLANRRASYVSSMRIFQQGQPFYGGTDKQRTQKRLRVPTHPWPFGPLHAREHFKSGDLVRIFGDTLSADFCTNQSEKGAATPVEQNSRKVAYVVAFLEWSLPRLFRNVYLTRGGVGGRILF